MRRRRIDRETALAVVGLVLMVICFVLLGISIGLSWALKLRMIG